MDCVKDLHNNLTFFFYGCVICDLKAFGIDGLLSTRSVVFRALRALNPNICL
jgi:hypothetical protein